jgi:hypothetical protein
MSAVGNDDDLIEIIVEEAGSDLKPTTPRGAPVL